jgi:4-hydroxy-tetrahydrodipicolinate reductase
MKIALIGTGKMGQAIASLAQNSGHEIVVSIGGENKHLLSAHVLRQADVAIEFTQPEAAPANLRLCLSAGIPVVCGTT